jgi:hypothetical protein
VAGVVGERLRDPAAWRASLAGRANSVLNRSLSNRHHVPPLPLDPTLPPASRPPSPAHRRRPWPRPSTTCVCPLPAVSHGTHSRSHASQHKHLQPAGAATQGGPSLQSHHSISRLNDAFETVRQEYDQLLRELETTRSQRDELDKTRVFLLCIRMQPSLTLFCSGRASKRTQHHPPEPLFFGR